MEAKIIIEQVDWIDKAGLEAEVCLNIRGEKYWAYSCPCRFNEGIESNALIGFLEEEIEEEVFWNMNSMTQESKMEADINSRTRYLAYGKITSLHPVTIQCGNLELNNGDWINDPAVIGNYVYFVISRLYINST